MLESIPWHRKVFVVARTNTLRHSFYADSFITERCRGCWAPDDAEDNHKLVISGDKALALFEIMIKV